MKNGLESNFVVKYTVDQVAQNNLILMCSCTLKCPLVKAQNMSTEHILSKMQWRVRLPALLFTTPQIRAFKPLEKSSIIIKF